MGLIDSLNYIIIHTYNNKKQFFLSGLTIFISLYIMLGVYDINNTINYSYNEVQALESQLGKVYKIEIPLSGFSFEYSESIYELVNEYPDIIWYEYMNIKLEEKNSTPKFTDFLYISDGNRELLKDETGVRLNLTDGKYQAAAVGYALREMFPVGSVVTDSFTGKKYEITHILEQGSLWFDDDVPDGHKSVKSLDAYIVTSPDRYYYENGIGMLSCLDNIIILDDEKTESLIQNIKESAVNRKIPVMIRDFDDCIDEDKKQYSALYSLNHFMNIFLFVSMLLYVASVSIASWLMKKREIGILLTFGYQRKDIFRLVCVENLFRLVIPFILIIIINFFANSYKPLLTSNIYVLLEVYLMYVLVMLAVSFIIYLAIDKNVLKNVKG